MNQVQERKNWFDEWEKLAQKLKDGIYVPPVTAIVLNGEPKNVVIRDVRVVPGKAPPETRVEIVCESETLQGTFANPIKFKIGKDGRNRMIFLTDFNRPTGG